MFVAGTSNRGFFDGIHTTCAWHASADRSLVTMRELNLDGVPSCRFCQAVTRDIRRKWADHFCEWWPLDPFTGNPSKDLTAGLEGVARMAVHDASTPDSRRASSDIGGDSSYLPQGVSYYNQPTGYGRASSVGELASRETSHHVGYDEACPSISQSSPLLQVEA